MLFTLRVPLYSFSFWPLLRKDLLRLIGWLVDCLAGRQTTWLAGRVLGAVGWKAFTLSGFPYSLNCGPPGTQTLVALVLLVG